jgi:chitinase
MLGHADTCEDGEQEDEPAKLGKAAKLASASRRVKQHFKVETEGEKGLPFEKAIIGYWGSGPYTPFEGLEGPSIADALKEGYNVINVAFADTFNVNGSFQIHTDMCPTYNSHDMLHHMHECVPSKKNISKDAGVPINSWRYMLSFGGAGGPGPHMPSAVSLRERSGHEDKFADGFIKRYKQVKARYGFDGIDVDIESSMTTPLLAAFRKIFKKLHADGELISVAPESPSLNPAELKSFFEGSFNSYAPLVDSSIINHVSWVAPQLYNDAIPFKENPIKYVQSLYAAHTLEWDEDTLEVKVPPAKVVLGFPATPAAAPARKLPKWESSPEALLEMYRKSPELLETKGVMTWSIGHDYSNGWKWVKAMKQIWDTQGE